jgi:hypothetical protein
MKAFRTSLAFAMAVALSWSTAAFAEDRPKQPDKPRMPATTDAPVSPPAGDSSSGHFMGDDGTEVERRSIAPDPLPSTTPRRPGTVYDDGSFPTSKTTTTSGAFDSSPERDRPQTGGYTPHRPLLITGSALLLGAYATSVGVAAVSDLPADDRLYVPIAGPFLNLGDRPCPLASSQCSDEEDLAKASILGLGLAQGAGLGLTIASFFVKERPAETRIKVPENAEKASFSIVPYGAGASAVGRF